MLLLTANAAFATNGTKLKMDLDGDKRLDTIRIVDTGADHLNLQAKLSRTGKIVSVKGIIPAPRKKSHLPVTQVQLAASRENSFELEVTFGDSDGYWEEQTKRFTIALRNNTFMVTEYQKIDGYVSMGDPNNYTTWTFNFSAGHLVGESRYYKGEFFQKYKASANLPKGCNEPMPLRSWKVGLEEPACLKAALGAIEWEDAGTTGF